MAQYGSPHFGWTHAQGPHEAQGSHHLQEEACPRQEGSEESHQGGLQGEEGNLQAVSQVRESATDRKISTISVLEYTESAVDPSEGSNQ